MIFRLAIYLSNKRKTTILFPSPLTFLQLLVHRKPGTKISRERFQKKELYYYYHIFYEANLNNSVWSLQVQYNIWPVTPVHTMTYTPQHSCRKCFCYVISYQCNDDRAQMFFSLNLIVLIMPWIWILFHDTVARLPVHTMQTFAW